MAPAGVSPPSVPGAGLPLTRPQLPVLRRPGSVRLRPPRWRGRGVGPGGQILHRPLHPESSTDPGEPRPGGKTPLPAPVPAGTGRVQGSKGPGVHLHLHQISALLVLQAVHTPLQTPKSYIYPYRDMTNVARRKLAAMVSTVDEAVRNVTYALRKYGYYRNSVIIYSTDNGAQPFTGGSNWPLRGRKVGSGLEPGPRGVRSNSECVSRGRTGRAGSAEWPSSTARC